MKKQFLYAKGFTKSVQSSVEFLIKHVSRSNGEAEGIGGTAQRKDVGWVKLSVKPGARCRFGAGI